MWEHHAHLDLSDHLYRVVLDVVRPILAGVQ